MCRCLCGEADRPRPFCLLGRDYILSKGSCVFGGVCI